MVAQLLPYLDPLEILTLQRVAKQWRMVLASEYVYTEALHAHFRGTEEEMRVWELHEGGEKWPEEAVEGFLDAAKRWKVEKT